MVFCVDLEIFRGPLDLLLYLVRKHEVEIVDIPISIITDQFLEHLAILEKLDVNAVGDFLEMASILIELKSRFILPQADEEDGEIEDPRQELVQRLLEYKKYRDAASMLEEQSRHWQQHFSRISRDIAPRRRDLADEPIENVELWDLVGAFGRILRQSETSRPSSVIYDDTPIEVYMKRISQRLQSDGRSTISDLFDAGMHKSALIGIFLAILELVRHHHVRTEQNELHGEIWIFPGDQISQTLDQIDINRFDHPTETIDGGSLEP